MKLVYTLHLDVKHSDGPRMAKDELEEELREHIAELILGDDYWTSEDGQYTFEDARLEIHAIPRPGDA